MIIGFILKTVTFAMSGWVALMMTTYTRFQHPMVWSAQRVELFLTRRPIYGLHATLPSFPQTNLLKYFPLEGQLSMCAFSELRDAYTYSANWSQLPARETQLSITNSLCKGLLCHTCEAVPAFGTAHCTHFFFFPVKAFRTVLLSNFKKKLSKQLFQGYLH